MIFIWMDLDLNIPKLWYPFGKFFFLLWFSLLILTHRMIFERKDYSLSSNLHFLHHLVFLREKLLMWNTFFYYIKATNFDLFVGSSSFNSISWECRGLIGFPKACYKILLWLYYYPYCLSLESQRFCWDKINIKSTYNPN